MWFCCQRVTVISWFSLERCTCWSPYCPHRTLMSSITVRPPWVKNHLKWRKSDVKQTWKFTYWSPCWPHRTLMSSITVRPPWVKNHLKWRKSDVKQTWKFTYWSPCWPHRTLMSSITVQPPWVKNHLKWLSGLKWRPPSNQFYSISFSLSQFSSQEA